MQTGFSRAVRHIRAVECITTILGRALLQNGSRRPFKPRNKLGWQGSVRQATEGRFLNWGMTGFCVTLHRHRTVGESELLIQT